ncbi:MAG: glycosyltransferase [Verrucomicrobiales bacterium]
MKILHHVQSLAETQGGLAVAVADLCSALSSLNCEGVITVANNGGNSVPVSKQVKVIDLGISNALWSHFLPAPKIEFALDLQLIHQHGLWTRSMREVAAFSKRSGIPLVLSPHGMLEPWALEQRAIRKRIAFAMYQNAILKQACGFHATSDAEAGQIRKLGFSQPIAVIPNSAPDGWDPSFAGGRGERTAIFLSRLHEKKGVELLLEAWASASPSDWKLRIYGEGEPTYQQKIRRMIADLGLSKNASLVGPVYGDLKWKAMGEAELFILPSYSENFGIVVVEALKSGTPVITTTATPWKLIEHAGCGWCVEPTVDRLKEALKDAVSKSELDLEAMGRAGSRLVDEQFRSDKNAEKMSQFYQWLSGEGKKPSFVIE